MLEHGSVKGILCFFKSSWAHALCQAGVPVLGGQDHHAALDWGCNGGALFLKMIFQHAVPPACHTLPWASRCHVSGVHGLVRGLRFQFHMVYFSDLREAEAKTQPWETNHI